MRTYAAVKSTSAARAGSIARNEMSAAPVVRASKDLRAASKQVKSTGTRRREAISRARSTVTPEGADEVPCASTGFPRLIEALRVPVGARSRATSDASVGIGSPYADDARCRAPGRRHTAAGPPGLEPTGLR